MIRFVFPIVILFAGIALLQVYPQLSIMTLLKPSTTTPLPTIVIGSGLAGLTSTYHLLKAKSPVILLEKSDQIGGNSIKASSGINGILTSTQDEQNVTDSFDWFLGDVVKSSKKLGDIELQKVLVNESSEVIKWLQDDVGVSLDIINRLGGHSIKRTHRSTGKPPGFEIISKLKDKVVNDDNLTLLMKSKLLSIDTEDKKVKGVRWLDLATNETKYLKADNVIVATGGFGYSKEFLKKYKPEFANFPTTNSEHTIGEGHSIIEQIGGELIDMEQVQIHPTGFIKQDDRDNNWKFLAAESLRGVGGILLNHEFKRFVNELDRRDVVSKAILNQKDQKAWLVLNEDMYKDFQFQIDFYQKMNLFTKTTVQNFNLDIIPLLQRYSIDGSADDFDRDHKQNLFRDVKPETVLYVAEVTPVVHFTMGGVKIGLDGDVQGVSGLFAVGEVSGGVHGENRLAGNSLLECAVFGKRAAQRVLHLRTER